MERRADLNKLKTLFGKYFIGPKELSEISAQTGIAVPEVPEIAFSNEILAEKAKDHLLFLGASHMNSGEPVTLHALRAHFGIDPQQSEPCFYNQDWYLNEAFMQVPVFNRWYLLRKEVITQTRSVSPDELLKTMSFPPAVVCSYAFFIFWFHAKECLWKHDFIWCSDTDHNGDRVYVAKYHDVTGVNKNGFSIHRHLRLRDMYGAINYKG